MYDLKQELLLINHFSRRLANWLFNFIPSQRPKVVDIGGFVLRESSIATT